MPVTNNFASSSLDLNGKVALTLPTALVWGPDGRLYVTEVDGDVRVLSVAFGDKDPNDANITAQFYVTAATSLNLIKAIQNHNDDGSLNSSSNRQITGIDVTQQFNANGQPMLFNGKPAVTMYITSSDSRIGAGTGGGDSNLDTNSGIITKLVQTGPNSWDAVDIIRGLPRSEENHATNGLEVIQEVDASGTLVSERMIVASGGNANAGAPSNNFAGQQEQPLSAAILEIDLDALRSMPVLTDGNGRKYVYDLPTLNDPIRSGNSDANDPFGGRDGLNGAKLLNDGIVSIYSAGYRNAYDVEVSEDGRVWSYDNGANNSWGGRPIGEAGDNNTTDHGQDPDYIATNLNNGDGNTGDDINLVNWNPSNKDNFHEITRSDDLAGRTLSAGQGGAQTYVGPDGLTYVYGGHPNPTRAEGAVAGLLFSPKPGTDDAFLLVSTQDSYADAVNETDYQQVIGWLAEVEANDTAFPGSGAPFGAASGSLTKKVIAVTPGVAYDIYKFADGSGAAVVQGGQAPAGGTLIGTAGLPADFAQIVAFRNKIEGNYKEAGKTDGALDTGTGSINGLAEYTSTVFDEGTIKMSGAIIATDYNGDLIIMGRNADGTMSSTVQNGFAVAADRTTLSANGTPLGIDAIGDDYLDQFLPQPFQGSVWVAGYQNQPFIRIYQPNNGAVPLAGVGLADPTDKDLDGLDHVIDPFEFSDDNGFALAAGNQLVLDFSQLNQNFPDTLGATGLLGAALDGETPNRDEQTVTENYTGDQIRDGLFNNGENLILGANADFVQIKNVVPGTVVGAANTARDVLQTGIRPAANVGRIVIDLDMKNWIPIEGGVEPGQLTGLIFGDGTQANFVRFVFGSVNGQPGFEVGYEIGDANYQVVGTLAEPDLSDIDIATLELRFEIDKSAGYAVHAFYRLEGEANFTEISLNGFTIPPGVLRDVLDGTHTVGTGTAAKVSGAAVGLLAETTAGSPLASIDFDELRIEAFGNPGGSVLIGIADAPSVVESGDAGSTTLAFPLTASNAFSGTATVTYDIAGGATGATANVTFTSGQGALSIAVPNDNVANGPDTVAVTLTAVSGTGGGTFAVDWSHASGNGLVTEDDAPAARFVFRLVDADTDTVLDADLSDGVQGLTAADLAGTLAVAAYAAGPGGITGPVAMTLSGPSGTFSKTESVAPYAVFGDTNGNFAGKVLQAGQYAFSATNAGQTENVVFTLQAPPPPPAPKVSVLDATTGESGSVAVTFQTDTAVPSGQTVTVNFQIVAGSATPALDYQAAGLTFANGVYSGSVQIVGGSADKTVTIDILPDSLVEGNETFAVNIVSVAGAGATVADGSATVTITDDDTASSQVVYRWNAGTSTVAAIDGGPDWVADAGAIVGTAKIASNAIAASGTLAGSVPGTTPKGIFAQEYYGSSKTSPMGLEFGGGTLAAGTYAVRLYMGDGYNLTNDPGERVFDVSVEGQLIPDGADPDLLPDGDNVDLSARFGHLVGGMLEWQGQVTDGTVDIDFLHGVQNPLINGVEIIRLGGTPPPNAAPVISTPGTLSAPENQKVVVTVAASDANSDPITYSITGGTDAAKFAINAQTGALSFIAAPDFEAPGDADQNGVYQVEVGASDGKATTKKMLSVGVTDVAEGGAPGRFVFRLIDADTDTVLDANLADGVQGLTAADLAGTLAVAAYAAGPGGITGPVAMTLTGPSGSFSKTESAAPYAVFGDTNGNFAGKVLQAGQYTFSATNAGQTESVTFALQAGGTPPPAAPKVSVLDATVGESNGSVTVTFKTDTAVPSGQTVTVNFQIVAGSATPAQDYQAAGLTFANGVYSGSVQIAAGATTATVPVTILGDTAVEGNETFAVNIVSVAGAGATVADGSATVTITDDDTASSQVVYRWNAGTSTVAAIDGGPDWVAAAGAIVGAAAVASSPIAASGTLAGSVPGTTPKGIFAQEYYGSSKTSPMGLEFGGGTLAAGTYAVRLYMGDGYNLTNDPGERVFDVSVEGQLIPDGADPDLLPDGDNVDLSARFGHLVGGMLEWQGQVTDGTVDIDFLHGVQNPLINGVEIIRLGGTTPPPPPPAVGAATLTVTPTGNIQTSTFGANSFTLTNTGDKVITRVVIDITDALYPDMVFDPFGLAGDTAFKGLTINSAGGTGVVAPSNSSYIGAGGTEGYEAIQLVFNSASNGGFGSSEQIGFSIDNDPNSIAGAKKAPLDAGSSPSWDVGGVSGAELIGSRFTVEFSDGTSATGQLQGIGNQVGAKGIASQASPNESVTLTVNGLGAGAAGSYGDGGPTVFVQGQAGETARIVLTKGFIQPVTNAFHTSSDPADQAYAPQLDAQLAALADSDFPANNAVEFQTVDVVLDGSQQDISGLFNFTGVAAYNFAGEDRLPLGFVASVIDPDDDLPLGAVTDPIHLVYDELL